jgi:hypothetical protein
MQGGDEESAVFYSKNLKSKNHVADLDVAGNIILTWNTQETV